MKTSPASTKDRETRNDELVQAAKAERARRELARRKLMNYSQFVFPKYKRAAHLELISSELEDVYEYIESGGERGNGRLMVFVIPQSGKSTKVSMRFPSWVLGKRPDTRIALTSYVSTLAERNSRAVRNDITSEEFGKLFGQMSAVDDVVELSKDSRSAADWSLAPPHRGGVIARGVGGGITGYDLDLIVIDDPFKDRKAADSPAQREDVWKWWTSAILTRVRKGTAIILMHTRWHPDDLAGRLLVKMATEELAEQWRVVFLPALALEAPGGEGDCYAKDEAEQIEFMKKGVYLPIGKDPLGRKPGESVWEEEFPAADLNKRKVNVGTGEWYPVYQQMPKSKKGEMFRRDMFTFVKAVSAGSTFVRYWDKAATQDGGKRTAGVLMAKTPEERYVVAHSHKGQWSSGKREQQLKSMAERDSALCKDLEIYVEQEPGSGGKDSAVLTIKNLAGYRVFADVVSGQGSKELRAEPFQAQCEAGNVDILVGDWNEGFLAELEDFPLGHFKDQVDASSGAFNKLAQKKPKRESRIW